MINEKLIKEISETQADLKALFEFRSLLDNKEILKQSGEVSYSAFSAEIKSRETLKIMADHGIRQCEIRLYNLEQELKSELGVGDE